MARFAHSWFNTQAKPLWEKHLLPLRKSINTYLEIGCADGCSMYWVMKKLRVEKAFAIDPWEDNVKEKRAEAFSDYRKAFHRNTRRWKDRITTFQGTSFDILRDRHSEIPDDSVDLCYIDGAHRAWDVMGDTVLVWPKLKCGCIVVYDDLNRRWLNGKPLVLPGVHAFMTVYDSRYRVLFIEPRQAAFIKLK